MRKGIFGILFFFLLMLYGCEQINNSTNDPDISSIVISSETPTKQPEASPTEDASVNSIEDSITEVPVYDVDTNREIYVYAVNYETLEIEAILAIVPAEEELTPEGLLDIVTDTMGDEAFFISIDSVATQGDTVIVSFADDGEPVHGLTKQAEDAVLDAIAQSLLDNFDEYHNIIFRCEMEAYVSDNNSFSIDYIYMGD